MVWPAIGINHISKTIFPTLVMPKWAEAQFFSSRRMLLAFQSYQFHRASAGCGVVLTRAWRVSISTCRACHCLRASDSSARASLRAALPELICTHAASSWLVWQTGRQTNTHTHTDRDRVSVRLKHYTFILDIKQPQVKLSDVRAFERRQTCSASVYTQLNKLCDTLCSWRLLHTLCPHCAPMSKVRKDRG